MSDNYQKKLISLRYWLLGRSYHIALKALEYASTFHTGLRKDACTKEFDHQLSIAHYLKTIINHLDFPQETLAAAFLHDVAEDYDVGFKEIESEFNNQIAHSVFLCTKKHRGLITPADVYYQGISQDAIASITKASDRGHNIQTMTEVFSLEKQNSYIQETEEHVLPMLKAARRKFTTQEPAYENIKLILKNQIKLIRAINSAQN